MEYSAIPASRAAANTGLGLGIAGTALGLLNGGLGLMGTAQATEPIVNRYELQLTQENAILKAQADVDKKIVDAYNNLYRKIEDVKDAQAGINLMQATYNATNTANIGCLQNQVKELQDMTQRVIPSTNVFTPA